jgi:ABC-type nitrate/sulfonate/bicarbonate transport system substrate-binding protein
MNFMNRRFNSLSLAVCKFVLSFATVAILAAPASAQQLKEITIGLSSGSLTVGSVRIAKEMGVYEKYGLNPKFVVMESGNAALTGLIGGSFEAVVANTGDIVAAQGRGQKLVSIGSVYDGLGATLVLTKGVADKLNVSPTAPVNERFKALEGLMIALPSPTANYTLAFKIATQAYGVNIRSTYVPAANMPAAMESGAVQGFFTSAPFWTNAVVKGSAVVWLSGPKGEFPPQATPATAATMQMTRSFAEANPDIVKGLVGALADFAKAVEQRPADVRAATGKVFPGVDAATIDLFLSYEAAAWKTKPFTAKDMAHEITFVKASGIPVPGIDDLDPGSMIYSVK